jgi:hypothetical protein
MQEVIYSTSIAAAAIGVLLFMGFLVVVASGWVRFLGTLTSSVSRYRYQVAFIAVTYQIITTAYLLGLLGWLHRPAYIVLNLAIAMLLHWRAGIPPHASLPSALPDFLGRIAREALFWVSRPANLLWLIAVGIVVGRVAAIAAVSVPSLGDDLLYHISTLFQWVTDGAIRNVETRVIYTNVFPFNSEAIFLAPILFFKSDSFILLTHVLYVWVGVMVFVGGLAREILPKLGLSKWAALLYFSIPVVQSSTLTGYTDAIINLHVVAAIFFLFVLIRNFTDRTLHYSLALALIFIVGAKYSGFVTAVYWAVPYIGLWIYRRRTVKFSVIYPLRNLLLLAGCLLTIGCGWYIRNYVAYGNPFAPQSIKVGGSELFTTKTYEGDFMSLQEGVFKEAITPGNNIDFFQFMYQTSTFREKLELVGEMLTTMPKAYYPGAENQFGPWMLYVGIPAMGVMLLYLIVRKRWLLLGAAGLMMVFYLLQPTHLLILTRYTHSIILLPVLSVIGVIALIRPYFVHGLLASATLILPMQSALQGTTLTKPSHVQKLAKHYTTGEFFGAEEASEAYLICYDYMRLRVASQRIAYIGGNPYPYTYHLFGKRLQNTVHYFYTLDPQQWEQRLREEKISLVYYNSAVSDAAFAPILAYMKNNPDRFKTVGSSRTVLDQYQGCRDMLVYEYLPN